MHGDLRPPIILQLPPLAFIGIFADEVCPACLAFLLRNQGNGTTGGTWFKHTNQDVKQLDVLEQHKEHKRKRNIRNASSKNSLSAYPGSLKRLTRSKVCRVQRRDLGGPRCPLRGALRSPRPARQWKGRRTRTRLGPVCRIQKTVLPPSWSFLHYSFIILRGGSTDSPHPKRFPDLRRGSQGTSCVNAGCITKRSRFGPRSVRAG